MATHVNVGHRWRGARASPSAQSPRLQGNSGRLCSWLRSLDSPRLRRHRTAWNRSERSSSPPSMRPSQIAIGSMRLVAGTLWSMTAVWSSLMRPSFHECSKWRADRFVLDMWRESPLIRPDSEKGSALRRWATFLNFFEVSSRWVLCPPAFTASTSVWDGGGGAGPRTLGTVRNWYAPKKRTAASWPYRSGPARTSIPLRRSRARVDSATTGSA